MKNLIKASVCAAILLSVASFQTAFAQEQKPVKFNGEFVWSGDKTHTKTPVQVSLTPRGQDEYSAVYTFNWKGKLHNYRGTIKGSLQSGNVEGTGDADDAKRSFTFKGTATNGVITAKCFEIKGSVTAPQGSVEFKAQP